MLRAMAVLSLLCACDVGMDDDGTTGGRADAIFALTGDVANGQNLYEVHCVTCHAADGSGGIGSDIRNVDAMLLIDAMLVGRTNDGMVSYSFLGDQDIADITAYAESF